MATAAVTQPAIAARLRTTIGAGVRGARTPILVAVVGALLTFFAGLITQDLTRSSQDHAKRLELETTLAASMSTGFTSAVGTALSVGTGTVSSRNGSPVTPADYAAAYNRGLNDWQIKSAAVGAELSARFQHQPIVVDWRTYSAIVTSFFRVAAVQPPQSGERVRVVNRLRTYVTQVSRRRFDWQVFRDTNGHFARNLRFTLAYRAVTDWLLSRGDQLMEEMLALKPSV